MTRYRLLSLLKCAMARTPTRSQVSTSAPKDKAACVSQIAERHVTVARCDVRSALCDQQEVNVAPLPESDTGRNKATRFAASIWKQR